MKKIKNNTSPAKKITKVYSLKSDAVNPAAAKKRTAAARKEIAAADINVASERFHAAMSDMSDFTQRVIAECHEVKKMFVEIDKARSAAYYYRRLAMAWQANAKKVLGVDPQHFMIYDRIEQGAKSDFTRLEEVLTAEEMEIRASVLRTIDDDIRRFYVTK